MVFLWPDRQTYSESLEPYSEWEMAMATWSDQSPDEKVGILPPTKDLAESEYTEICLEKYTLLSV